MRSVKSTAAAKLFGLVLAGGKSQRMGSDKGVMSWHGKPQREYLADLLGQYCDKTFISCRSDQKADLPGRQLIIDSYGDIGPSGALLSAMTAYPAAGWLVVACDLPMLDAQALEQLIEQRDKDMIATAYKSPTDGLPEPLAAIWEAKSKPILLQQLKAGIDCPRKVMINNNDQVKLIDPMSAKTLLNANTPDDVAQARRLISISV